MTSLLKLPIPLKTLLILTVSITNTDKQTINQFSLSESNVPTFQSNNDSSYVPKGFYTLADNGQGIKMRKDHSDETYNISAKPLVSVNNVCVLLHKKIWLRNVSHIM